MEINIFTSSSQMTIRHARDSTVTGAAYSTMSQCRSALRTQHDDMLVSVLMSVQHKSSPTNTPDTVAAQITPHLSASAAMHTHTVHTPSRAVCPAAAGWRETSTSLGIRARVGNGRPTCIANHGSTNVTRQFGTVLKSTNTHIRK
jgi:hypothetical protein